MMPHKEFEVVSIREEMAGEGTRKFPIQVIRMREVGAVS